tara:strand:- start:1527 stop:5576 length:4050 start_codon:yes stop_codon:yes gene_type:complete
MQLLNLKGRSAQSADGSAASPVKGPWKPRFLCDSLSSPVVLSDGRVTTCTLDHNGQNQLANINEHSFDEVVDRYRNTRYNAMARPISKPMCHTCYTRVTSWKERAVPRAGWMHPKFDDAAVERFEAAYDDQRLKLNIELSAKCNLRCIGCAVSDPNYADMRTAMNIDMDRLKTWVEQGAGRIDQLRLYHMGETWNHPRWAEFCRHVKEVDESISLFTSTNGMPLRTPQMLDDVIDVGFDHVVFSIHGATTASCQKYMGKAFDMDKALAVAKGLAERRAKAGTSKPYLSWKYILFTWNDSEEEIARAKALCDETGFDELHFTITSRPSPSETFRQGSPAWEALREECAELWPRAKTYQARAPMAAIYPGRRQRLHWNSELRPAPVVPAPAKSGPNAAKKAAPVSVARTLEQDLAAGRLSDVYERLSAKDLASLGLSQVQRFAEACVAVGRDEEALAGYERIVDAGTPSDYQLLAMASTLQRLGRHDEAIAAFDAGLSRREQLGGRLYGEQVYLELRASLLALGELDAAETAQRLWVEQSYLREPRSRTIYAPIPKNACTYFKTALVLNGPNKDAFLAGRDKTDAHKFIRKNNSNHRLDNLQLMKSERFFKFAILRNPFKRLASAYADIAVRPLRWREIPDAPLHPLVHAYQRSQGERLDLTRSISFAAFIDAVVNTRDPALDHHFRSQASFLPDPDAFDLIADCDNLDPLFDALAARRWCFDEVGERNETQYADLDAATCADMPAGALHQGGGAPRWTALFDADLFSKVRARFGEDFDLYESRFGMISGAGQGPLYPTGGALVLDDPEPRASKPKAAVQPVSPNPFQVAAEAVTGRPDQVEEAGPDDEPAFELTQAGESHKITTHPGGLQEALEEAERLIAGGARVTVILRDGVYRGAYSLRGKDAGGALVIQAEAGAAPIMSGSEPLTGWVAETDALWCVPWPHRFELSSAPPDYGDPWLATPDLMRRCEQIILGGRALRQVLERDDLTPGTFWIDDNANLAFMHPPVGGDPATQSVEASARSQLLHLTSVSGLTVRGLRFEHDASGFYLPQTGALQLTNCKQVQVEHCTFAANNNKGLQIDGRDSEDITLSDLIFLDNGCVGLLASRVQGLSLERVSFTGQNRRGAWAGHYRGSPAGAKIMKSQRVRISNCRAIRNLCTGLWLDERNRDVEITDSVFSSNYRGLHVEATPGPVLIERCTITDNRREPTPTQWAWRFGSGLALTHAQAVTVRACTLSGNDTAQIGVRHDRETRRLRDTLTGEESEEFTADITLEANTILAARGQACLQIPGPGFDGARCWESFKAFDNYYAAAEPGRGFVVSDRDAVQTLGFADWAELSGQDEESQNHG